MPGKGIATMASYSYVMGVLRVLRHTPHQSLEQITEALFRPDSEAAPVRRLDTWDAPDSAYGNVQTVLDELVQLGFVIEENLDGKHIYLAAKKDSGDGGGDRARPPSNGNGNGFQFDGSGIGEVLAHPVLFSYGDEEFDSVLSRALQRYQ